MSAESISPLIIESLSYYVLDGEQPRQLFEQLSLTIEQGECVALMGDSGSGKSTLLSLIAGLKPIQQGAIVVNGVTVNTDNEQRVCELRKQYLSIIFQNYNLLPGLSVADNIAFSAKLAGRYDPALCAELAQQLGLVNLLAKRPSQLSGGEQQRVAIARAIAVKPSLILADEPTGNLDQQNSDRVLSQLLSLTKKYQTSLLLVTHSHHLASQLDRIVQLTQGSLRQIAAGSC